MLTTKKPRDDSMPPPKGYTRKLVSLLSELAERVTDYRFKWPSPEVRSTAKVSR